MGQITTLAKCANAAERLSPRAGCAPGVRAATARALFLVAVKKGSKETFAALITNGCCRTKTSGQNMGDKNGSLIAALSSGMAICPFGVMVLSEVAHCAS
jgi:hypothetical protein